MTKKEITFDQAQDMGFSLGVSDPYEDGHAFELSDMMPGERATALNPEPLYPSLEPESLGVQIAEQFAEDTYNCFGEVAVDNHNFNAIIAEHSDLLKQFCIAVNSTIRQQGNPVYDSSDYVVVIPKEAQQ